VKEVIQKNIAVFWIGVFILSASKLISCGITATSLLSVLIFSITPTITLALYFVPLPEKVKAILINLCLSFACLFVSAVKGGTTYGFLLTYLVLAFVAIYFDPIIIFGYSIIYILIACGFAYKNADIIAGKGSTVREAVIQIVGYFFMAFILWMAANRGQKFIRESLKQQNEAEEKSKELEENSTVAKKISQELGMSLFEQQKNAQEISEGCQTVSEAAQQMSIAVEDTTNSILNVTEKINAAQKKVEENTSLANDLKDSYREVIDKVELGKEEGGSAKISMENITETIHSAHHSTIELLDETGKITDILEEIDAIAAQTNLLAINASIEAAHAGEHGKGFLVVADEIKHLSDQSRRASANIQDILNKLIKVIKEVSSRVEKGVENVDTGTQNLDTLLNIFEELYIKAKHSEQIIEGEFFIISEVKDDFQVVLKEVQHVVENSNENSAIIESVTNSILGQNNSMLMISESINQIKGLSEKLEEQYN